MTDYNLTFSEAMEYFAKGKRVECENGYLTMCNVENKKLLISATPGELNIEELSFDQTGLPMPNLKDSSLTKLKWKVGE